MARQVNYWLMKSEPNTYSIDDLANEKTKTTCWEGVRNYQARNMMRDKMKAGDLMLFYHSSANPAGVAGIAKIVKESYPDFTAFDPKSKYFDAKSDQGNPRWFMVDIKLVKKFKLLIAIDELRGIAALKNMVLFNNSRLSVQPVTKKEFETIQALGN